MTSFILADVFAHKEEIDFAICLCVCTSVDKANVLPFL